ncbi:hypothetical protein M3Y94_00517000 [Aphelenchoides besseyi]|nr:hypothetical protein M3Y94_00517000 [Aphelenchoides besseyi]
MEMRLLVLLYTLFNLSLAWDTEQEEHRKEIQGDDHNISWGVGGLAMAIVISLFVQNLIIVFFAALRGQTYMTLRTSEAKATELQNQLAKYEKQTQEYEVAVAEQKEKLRENIREIEERDSKEEKALEKMMEKLVNERRALAAQKNIGQAEKQQKLATNMKMEAKKRSDK